MADAGYVTFTDDNEPRRRVGLFEYPGRKHPYVVEEQVRYAARWESPSVFDDGYPRKAFRTLKRALRYYHRRLAELEQVVIENQQADRAEESRRPLLVQSTEEDA